MSVAPKVIFAGDRDISVNVLKFLIHQDIYPQALIIQEKNKGSHTDELLSLCPFLDESKILRGDAFRKNAGIQLLQEMAPDYIISIHYPYIYPSSVLNIAKHGVLNLHPAYLPFNRGWHTPTWALLEDTPYGATLHFMSDEIDQGDIVHQKKLTILPEDTADSLYRKVKSLEFEVFREAWPSLANFSYQKIPQFLAEGTVHKKHDLSAEIRRLNLDEKKTIQAVFTQLKALTTNQIHEAAYFEVNGERYYVRIDIKKA